MKNIVFISHHLAGVGGVQKFIEILAKQFLADGHHVDVIGISVPKGVTYEKPVIEHPQYQEICLYHQDVFTTYPHKLFFDAFITHKSAKKIQAIIDNREKPIIIVVNPLSYILLKNVDLTNADQVLGQMHSSASFLFYNNGIYKAYLYFVKKYYGTLDKFLFLTEQDAQEATTLLGWNNISYVANPLPFENNAGQLAPLKAKRLIMVGRIDENKQVNHAIDIFSLLANQHPDWTFEIYGTGNKEQEIATQIKTANLNRQIKLKGFCQDVKSVLQTATIMLLTSRKEGIPMAAMEAIACGVPVVAYNCSPGVEEVVGHSGVLIAPDDKQAFAQAVETLMIDANQRKKLQQKGYQYIQKYNAKNIADIWYQLFQK